MMNSKKTLLTIFAVICGLLTLVPIYFLVIGGFKTSDTVFDIGFSTGDLTFENMVAVFTDSNIPRAIWNSLLVSTTVTVVAMLFHAMAGYALARLNFPGRSFTFGYIISTLMVPFPVIMVPLYIVVNNLGMANSYLGLIVPMIFNAYGIFLFRQFYLEFPKEL